MAAKLQLDRQYHGMNFIWNISQAVGDHVDCPNLTTDVELVAIMSAEIVRVVRPPWLHASVRQGFVVNGVMDAYLAYWIRIFNTDVHHNMASWEEGIVSPARGVGWGSGTTHTWTIVKMNKTLNDLNPSLWQNFPNHPNVSPTLRQELQG